MAYVYEVEMTIMGGSITTHICSPDALHEGKAIVDLTQSNGMLGRYKGTINEILSEREIDDSLAREGEIFQVPSDFGK